jgi:hypothetical protein
MARLREDPRFKAVQPDQFDTEPSQSVTQDGVVSSGEEVDEEDGLEIWFDWAFVDFWKNNYCALAGLACGSEADLLLDTIQRSIAVDPDAVRGSTCRFVVVLQDLR